MGKQHVSAWIKRFENYFCVHGQHFQMSGFNKRLEDICKDIFIKKKRKSLTSFQHQEGRRKWLIFSSDSHNLNKQVQIVNFRFKVLSNVVQKALGLWSHVPCYRLRLILPCTGLQSVVSGRALYYLIYFALQAMSQTSQKPMHLLGLVRLVRPYSLPVYPFFS